MSLKHIIVYTRCRGGYSRANKPHVAPRYNFVALKILLPIYSHCVWHPSIKSVMWPFFIADSSTLALMQISCAHPCVDWYCSRFSEAWPMNHVHYGPNLFQISSYATAVWERAWMHDLSSNLLRLADKSIAKCSHVLCNPNDLWCSKSWVLYPLCWIKEGAKNERSSWGQQYSRACDITKRTNQMTVG